MTELEKLMGRLDSLETELIKNRDFLAKTHSLCFDAKTKEDVTACINSKLDLINWIREQNEEILADVKYDKERESDMGIWDKAIMSAGDLRKSSGKRSDNDFKFADRSDFIRKMERNE